VYPAVTDPTQEQPEQAQTPKPTTTPPQAPQEEPELVPENVEVALKAIYKECEREDAEIRQRHLGAWRQLQLYAKGIFDLFWDETAHDWRSFTNEPEDDSNQYGECCSCIVCKSAWN